jgi:ATP/maltotriose-dependent transcriptional regulator MalT
MELIERDNFLGILQSRFDNTKEEGGHCIFLSGESGIGKTSLIRAFTRKTEGKANIYQGTCDSLFAPRPLAPVNDIVLKFGNSFPGKDSDLTDHTSFFTSVFQELKNKKGTSLVIFEDIHWADEATLDFIKFLARRISQLQCLFILSYRDNEIHTDHPLRNVLGQLNAGSFTRLQLPSLSKQAVEKMAAEKGYRGDDVYSISGGNPFYVTELLADYNTGIPDSIKDSILSAYNRTEEKTRQIWDLISITPDSFETKYIEKIEPGYASSIENSLASGILFIKEGRIFFKHELFRRTIESSLSPFKRVSLNKKILDQLLENFEQNGDIERIIHHAKNANEYELVVKYAPIAGRRAATLGAHTEAAKLFFSTIEYYQGNDSSTLIQFYEPYAYECYLTNQLKEAIIYQEKALHIWEGKNNIEKTGDTLRFLSRLWWFEGKRDKAETYAKEAIEALEKEPPSRIKAMALSNMSTLKLISYNLDESIAWGVKAIAIAKELADEAVLCHALTNVGASQCLIQSSRQEGIEKLQQSIEIAQKNCYHEDVARAYFNLAMHSVKMKDYVLAKRTFEESIQFCEDRDLDLYTILLLVFRARLHFETGNWPQAYDIANDFIKKENQLAIVKTWALVIVSTIKMRTGDSDLVPLLLKAKEKAFETMEPRSVIPTVIALLEYEWITGTSFINQAELNSAISLSRHKGNIYEKSEFAFWLLKVRRQQLELDEYFEGYDLHNKSAALNAADLWKQLGCPYEQALALFEGDEDDKRMAVEIIHNLGADAVSEKMKFEMRTLGIKGIPRGIRKTTQANPAHLTKREMDVLQLVKEGLQNKEIARKLFLSPKTIDHHISSIFFKLDVTSRAKAIQEAIHLHILK